MRYLITSEFIGEKIERELHNLFYTHKSDLYRCKAEDLRISLPFFCLNHLKLHLQTKCCSYQEISKFRDIEIVLSHDNFITLFHKDLFLMNKPELKIQFDLNKLFEWIEI